MVFAAVINKIRYFQLILGFFIVFFLFFVWSREFSLNHNPKTQNDVLYSNFRPI